MLVPSWARVNRWDDSKRRAVFNTESFPVVKRVGGWVGGAQSRRGMTHKIEQEVVGGPPGANKMTLVAFPGVDREIAAWQKANSKQSLC